MANEVRINVTSRDRSGPGFKSARNRSDELGNSTRRIGEIASGILASQVFERIGEAAVRAFTSTIHAASNLNESVNAVGVVFGDAADGVLAIGENSASSLGLSQRAFNEAAVRFSAFAQTIAGDGGNVAQVVDDITQRSSDFASVMNIDVAKAMELFQSGLAGESEPLRRYGIDVSAAATKTEAYASGIAEAGSELTEAEKVQARYNLIMKQTADTQGDFANTSDELANAQRIFGAELEDLQASMGQNMLPVLGQVVSFMTDVLRGFQALPGPVQTTALLLAGVTAAATAGAIALRALGISLTAVKTALGPIAIALAIGGAIIGGLAALGKTSEQASGNVEGLAQTLERGTGAFTNATREAVLLELQQKGLADSSRDLGLATDDVVAAYLGEEDALARVNGRLDETIAAGTTYNEVRQKGTVIRVDKVLDDDARAAARLKEAIAAGNITTEEAIVLARDLGIVGEESAAATDHSAGIIDEATAKMADAWAESVDKITDAGDAYSEMLSDLEEDEKASVDAFLEQMERKNEIAAEFNDNIVKITNRASEDVREQMLEDAKDNPELAALMVSATEQEWDRMEEAYRDATEAATTASHDAMVRATPELTMIAEAMGQKMARGIARKLSEGGNLSVREARKIFDNIDKEFHDDIAATIRPTMSEFNYSRVLNRIGNLTAPRTLWVTPRVSGGGIRITGPGFSGSVAHGGIIGSGTEPRGLQGGGPADRRVLVGEHRPEVVDLPVGSRVIPSVDQAMDRNQSGDGGMDIAPLISALTEALAGVVVANHIEIGGEVVRTVETTLAEHNQFLKRRVLSGEEL